MMLSLVQLAGPMSKFVSVSRPVQRTGNISVKPDPWRTSPPLCPGLGFRYTQLFRSPVAMDEMFELFDNEFLITDNAIHHVANRDYTDQPFTFDR
jgi:hypothetical protein